MQDSLLISDTREKLENDWELQEWGKMLVDEGEGLGIKVRGKIFNDLNYLYLNCSSFASGGRRYNTSFAHACMAWVLS